MIFPFLFFCIDYVLCDKADFFDFPLLLIGVRLMCRAQSNDPLQVFNQLVFCHDLCAPSP